MFASLQGRFTASQPPDPKAGGSRHCDGVAHGGEIFPEDPLASQQPCRGLLGPETLPLVGGAPGCDLSDPSHVMEPRGTVSHTVTAMDPVHGIQSSFGSTDVTQTTQRGAVRMNSYGSESMGEVSLGTASTAFTDHCSQPGDAARQPFTVNDSGSLGCLGPPGPVISLGYRTWGYPHAHGSGDGVGPLGSPAMPDPRSISLPGISRLSGAQPSLSGVRDSPAPLWGPGNFQGQGKRQPSGRHRPSTLVELGRCPTGQRPP